MFMVVDINAVYATFVVVLSYYLLAGINSTKQYFSNLKGSAYCFNVKTIVLFLNA